MYPRRKTVNLALDYFGVINLILIAACAPALAAAKIFRNCEASRNQEPIKFSGAAVLPDLNDVNRPTLTLARNWRIAGDVRAASLSTFHEDEFPLAETLQSASGKSERSDPATPRFRRDDNAAGIRNAGSPEDYMSTYYAQRKAIMDKYKSQQQEIRERLKKTRSSIAATKNRKESEKIDIDAKNSTRDQTTETLLPNITDSTTEAVVFNPTTIGYNPVPAVPTFNSTIFNDTQITVSNTSQSFVNSSEDESADYSSESDSVTTTTTLPLAYETLRPPSAGDRIDRMDRTEGPGVEPPREKTWQTETENLLPQNEVDSNLTEHNLVRQERDNDTLIIDLGGQLTDPSVRNDSVRAFEQLEEMFFWDEPRDDERIPEINETGARTQNEDNAAAGNGNRTDDAGQSSDSLQFTVEIKSSPEVHVTKNVKTLKTVTTTYRNSTHEVIDVNGVTNSTERTNGSTAESYLPSVKNINFTYPTVIEPSAVGVGGGATEAEWCEECPHDYRWGDCDGSLFYVHNAFLRNKGPGAIDAVFGMNVDGPISITCVEALRYNQTRGIVTLHSGGPGHDFAKIRIRGFQGEGFSYIMKVWGLSGR